MSKHITGIAATSFMAPGFHDLSRYETGKLCRKCRRPTLFDDDMCATCERESRNPSVIGECLECGQTWPSKDGHTFRCGFCGSEHAEPKSVR